MSALAFDPHQFAARKAFAVEAHYTSHREFESTRLDYGDYQKMHTTERASRHKDCVPPFALNTDQFRKVLMLRGLRYLSSYARVDEVHNAAWQELNRRATEKALRGYVIRPDAPRVQHEMQARHRAAIRRSGGFLQHQTAVAYRAWRLGQDSVAVAESLGIQPTNVRAILQRLRDAARDLGFEVGVDRRSEARKGAEKTRQRMAARRGVAKVPKIPQPAPMRQTKPERIPRAKQEPEPKLRRAVNLEKVAALRNRGLTFHAIGKEIGFCCPAIRRAVRRAGLRLAPAAKEKGHRSPLSGFDAGKVVELYTAGQSVSQIASLMGYRTGTGQNRVRYTLIRAGVYTRKRNRAALQPG